MLLPLGNRIRLSHVTVKFDDESVPRSGGQAIFWLAWIRAECQSKISDRLRGYSGNPGRLSRLCAKTRHFLRRVMFLAIHRKAVGVSGTVWVEAVGQRAARSVTSHLVLWDATENYLIGLNGVARFHRDERKDTPITLTGGTCELALNLGSSDQSIVFEEELGDRAVGFNPVGNSEWA